jgi:hypothetical protein
VRWLATGYVLLLLAWVFATTPFAAPDEASHYLRALSITNGHLLGAKIPYREVPLTPTQSAFVDQDTRAVQTPAALTPPDVRCADGRVNTAGCVEPTPTGDYPPPAYLLPAAALSVASSSDAALWLSRLGDAIPCAALIVLAAFLLAEGSGWSLLGLLGALTPMVLYVCSILNPSGLEVAASLAFTAGALRISRGPRAPRWVWWGLIAAGIVAILAFQAGPAFVLLDGLAAIALLEPGIGLRERWRRDRRPLIYLASALVAAMVLWLVYSSVSGEGHSTIDIHPIRAALHDGVSQMSRVLGDAVGNFGGESIMLPAAVIWLWWLGVAGLVVGAVWYGSARERVATVATAVIALAFPVVTYAWVYRQSGFGMQGRQVLPALLLIPLVAGEVIWRHVARAPAGRARRRGRMLLAAIGAGAGVFQLYAFWFNARTNAAPGGAVRFFSAGAWAPPLGWIPWLAAGVLGAVLVAVSFRADTSLVTTTLSGSLIRPGTTRKGV